MSPSGVVLPASLRKTSWKWLKFGRSGTSVMSDLDAGLEGGAFGLPP